ncbi:SDR family NAD(P)-dependent oxidoreductase [bacterium]|nr:SDR family NAD(P)-dependent oxidoreductase [bacterium]
MTALFDYTELPLAGQTALITGASSGIGEAMARALASRGVNLFLVARRKERLDTLKQTILAAIPNLKVTTIPADITSPEGMEAIRAARGFDADILINNAGGALGKDPVATARLDDWHGMIASNLTAAAEIVRAILPGMQTRGRGDIITIASVAGHQAYEGGSIYCAVKAGIRSFSQALRQETCGQNIRVMLISPGMVETEFSLVRFHGDQAAADAVYKGLTPLTSNDIARQMLFALQQPRHVCMDEILTLPTDQGSVTKAVRKS